MNQENRKSKWDWLADRPLDQLFSEALDHVGRRYYNGERKWKEKERPALAKRIRQARNHNPREYDFAVLTKMIKESELVRERYFFIHTSEFAWVAMAAEDAKQELQALKAELSDLNSQREDQGRLGRVGRV